MSADLGASNGLAPLEGMIELLLEERLSQYFSLSGSQVRSEML
jgi:hypothetical protein